MMNEKNTLINQEYWYIKLKLVNISNVTVAHFINVNSAGRQEFKKIWEIVTEEKLKEHYRVYAHIVSKYDSLYLNWTLVLWWTDVLMKQSVGCVRPKQIDVEMMCDTTEHRFDLCTWTSSSSDTHKHTRTGNKPQYCHPTAPTDMSQSQVTSIQPEQDLWSNVDFCICSLTAGS